MRLLSQACGVLALGLALCAPLHAQTADRDPRALAALQKMGSYLRTLDAFRITGPSTTEYVMDDGQKYRVDGQVDYLARLPGQLRAKISNPGQVRELFLDGKTLTVHAPALHYYASAPLQGDLQSLLVDVQDRYGVQLPLADLFWFGTAQAPTDSVLAAAVVGPARIDGAKTTQYAFRQQGVDWQVWIEDGAQPLPRRFVITDTTDPARPQYTADLRWELKPRIGAADFDFKPGQGDHPIKLVAANAAEVQP